MYSYTEINQITPRDTKIKLGFKPFPLMLQLMVIYFKTLHCIYLNKCHGGVIYNKMAIAGNTVLHIESSQESKS